MKGGFFLALDDRLFRRAAKVVTELGGVQVFDDLHGGTLQFADHAGRLFTLFERVYEGTEWEVREGPIIAAQGVQLPDMQAVIACPFECRWSDLVGHVAEAIARTAEAPTWVLDGDGVVWDAGAVDPRKILL